jgi:hypothetical protein
MPDDRATSLLLTFLLLMLSSSFIYHFFSLPSTVPPSSVTINSVPIGSCLSTQKKDLFVLEACRLAPPKIKN